MIKKTSETTPTMASIVDGYSTSTQDAYSCDYVNDCNTYSLNTEVDTGKKWIDGSTIYRKTFTGTRSGTATNIGSISNLGIITNAYGVATNSAGTLQQPIGYFDGANYVTLIKTTSGNINLYTADGLNGTYYITIEYTKSS